MERKTDEQMARDLAMYVNSFSHSGKKFAKELMNEHRTLQQNVMRLFMTCIKTWSEQEHYDDRNRATVELSKKIMKSVGEYSLPMI